MDDEIRLALKPGTEIDGYRIESILGVGGFGMTYRATEVMLDRHVAIKEYLPTSFATRGTDGLQVEPLTPQSAADFAWGMDRFRAEAQTLVAFRHPNIVPVLRYFEAHGTGYLVMEFVEGQTLSQMLLPDRTLDENQIHALMDPLLDGLKAVHDRGFLHRDIKPANIFIREDGSPVLIDFGAARLALGQQSKSLTAIISEGYAPYEQYDSTGEQGAWTDIYAVGGVLYRCVTGMRPPDSPSRISALVRNRPDPLVPLAQAAKRDYSAALFDAIDRALSVREDERPQSVDALRALMRPPAAALSGAPPDAAIPAPPAAELSATVIDTPPPITPPAAPPAAPPPADAPTDHPPASASPPAAADETLFAGPDAAGAGPATGDIGRREPPPAAAAAPARPESPPAPAVRPDDSAGAPSDKRTNRKAALIAAGILGVAVIGGGIWGVAEINDDDGAQATSTGGGSTARLTSAPLHDCDRLAADPQDMTRKAPGAFLFQIDAARALPACLAATKAYPDSGRLTFQLGRAHWAKGDRAAAGKLFVRAHEKGYPYGTYAAGYAHFFGFGVDRNRSRAIGLLKQAAKKNVLSASAMLAFWQVMGIGMKQDTTAGVSSLVYLAQQGSILAKYHLARIYLYGYGGKIDYKLAVRYAQELAENHKDPRAAHLLYRAYYDGKGIPKDIKKAHTYLSRAATAGFPNSFFSMGLAYRYGVPVRRDYTKAYFWFSLAARNKSPIKKVRELIAKQLDYVAQRLSATVRAKIDRQVAAWKPQVAR